MKELHILGASGHGMVVYDVARSLGKYEKISFFDDDPERLACLGHAMEAHGNIERLIQSVKGNKDAEAIVAVGNNSVRRKLQSRLEIEDVPIATLIHRNAVVSDGAKISPGTVIMPGAVVNRGALVGKGCIINTSSSVDHGSWVGDYCHISVGSHLAGEVKVGDGTLIGIGAVVRNNTTICGNCLIGSGAVVVSHIEIPGTYVGTPAKRMETAVR